MSYVPPSARLREAFRRHAPRTLRTLQAAFGSQYTRDCELSIAARMGDLNAVQFWMQHGANPNHTYALPLSWAIKYGHGEVVQYLIENGVNLKRYGDVAMYEAEQRKQPAVIEVLTKAGIEKNAAPRVKQRWERTGNPYPGS